MFNTKIINQNNKFVFVFCLICFVFSGIIIGFYSIRNIIMIKKLSKSDKSENCTITRIFNSQKSTNRSVYFIMESDPEREYRINLFKYFFNANLGDIYKVKFNEGKKFFIFIDYEKASYMANIMILILSCFLWLCAFILLCFVRRK